GQTTQLVGQRIDEATGLPKGAPTLIDDGDDGSGGGVEHKPESPTVVHCPATNLYMICFRLYTYPFAKFLNNTGAPINTGEPATAGYHRIHLNDKNNVGVWNRSWVTPIGLACDGTDFLAVFSDWVDYTDGDFGWGIGGLWGRRYSGDGRSLGPKFRIA